MGRIQTTIAFHLANQIVSTSALPLEAFSAITQEQVDRANRARITIEVNPVRYRYDGIAPTSAIGHLLVAGSELVIEGADNIRNLSFIRSGGADATVMVTLEE